jgi:signal transduction histidine kinase
VDPDRLEQLLLILLDNALRCSPPCSPAEVTCVLRHRDLVLEVADRGPAIPADRRAKALEWFTRLGDDRTPPGAGLGLSIATWIVTAHGDSIDLMDNRPGLRVRVVLPGV